MTSFSENITLQINISAGDIAYAKQTVHKQIEVHSQITERLLIVDCIRPQKTKVIDPEILFPEPEYSKKVAKIIEIGKYFEQTGLFKKVYYLKKEDNLIKQLAKKYQHSFFTETHDSRAVTIMGYWAGIELTETRYVLHYDADMLIYQQKGYDWAIDAQKKMETMPEIIISAPRNAPPSEKTGDVPTFHQGRPIESHDDYWVNDWFAARCYLIDKQKLSRYLPLLRGKMLLEAMARKLTNRSFPLAAEQIMFKRIGSLGGSRLILKTEDAWILHPVYKKKEFVSTLPRIFELIDSNNIPEAQKGWEDMKWDIWKEFLEKRNNK